MKESIEADDFINQGVDLVLGNPALQKRIVEPLTKKVVLPYVICTGLFNITILILLLYLVRGHRRQPP